MHSIRSVAAGRNKSMRRSPRLFSAFMEMLLGGSGQTVKDRRWNGKGGKMKWKRVNNSLANSTYLL